MKTGFIVITETGWRSANKVEDVQRHGPDIELIVDGDDEEDAGDFSGYSNEAETTDKFLARMKRSKDEERLARRLEECLIGDAALGLAGISFKARDRMIHALEDRLNGVPETLASQRAKLRHDAVRLAPQNLTVMIGAPEEKRRA